MKIDFLLVCLYYGLFISNSNNTIISSFLPQYAEEEFGIVESITGIIFAAHSIGLFIASLFVGKYMNAKGMKKKFLIWGLIIQAIGQGAFLVLDIIEDENIFILVSILGRLIVGAGMATYNVPAYSYIPILYNENLEYQYGALEAVGGFGLAIGPVFGGFLYQYLGFYTPFIFCFAASLAIVPFCFKFIPYSAKQLLRERKKVKIFERKSSKSESSDKQNYISLQPNKLRHEETNPTAQQTNQPKFDEDSINHKQFQTTIEDNNQSEINQNNHDNNLHQQLLDKQGENQQKSQHSSKIDDNYADLQDDSDGNESEEITLEINYKEILSNRYILTSFLVVVLQNAAYVYLDPTLAPYLQDEYKKSPDFIGMLFFIQSAVYLLLCPLGSFIAKKSPSYKYLLTFGLIVSGTAMFGMGPDPFFQLPHTIYLPVIACALIGFSTIFIYIPVLPDLNHSLGLLYPQIDDETKGDMSSALFNSSFAIGSFIGPASGGFLVQLFGFPRSSTFLGLMLIGFGILYIFIGGVLTIKKTTRMGENNKLVHGELEQVDFTRPHRYVGSFHKSVIRHGNQSSIISQDLEQFKRGGLKENALVESIISDHEESISFFNKSHSKIVTKRRKKHSDNSIHKQSSSNLHALNPHESNSLTKKQVSSPTQLHY